LASEEIPPLLWNP